MGNNRPSISVVVPIYNVAKLLPRCIDSILRQSLKPIEIILVDDGSPDNSGKICDQYATAFDIIKVIHKANGGLSSARKAGFKAATGDLIVFVDSDDYVAKDYLEKLSAPMSDPRVQLSMCEYYIDNGNSIVPHTYQSYGSRIAQSKIASDYILPIIGRVEKENVRNLPGFVFVRMYRRLLLRESDFVSEREYFTEDVILNILYACRLKGSIAIVKEPLCFYYINPGSLTLKYRKNVFEMRMACNELCRELVNDLPVSSAEKEMRLDANLISAVSFGVLNAGRLPTYRQFRDEIAGIFTHSKVHILFKNHLWPLKSSLHKAIYLSFYTKAYFLLYKLLRIKKID